MFMIDSRALIFSVAVSALLGLGWYVDHQKQTAALATAAAHHAKFAKHVADDAAMKAKRATAQLQAQQEANALLDAKRMKELKDAKAENDRLRRAVDAGAVQLRIAIKAARSQQLPGATGPASVDNGTAELSESARQAYFDLRESMSHDAAKLLALQDYVQTVCRPSTKLPAPLQ